MHSGMVFDIQRNSFVDGPGIRTTVFLKGCNLRCAWCHNPESQTEARQLLFYAAKCTGCGLCVRVCPAGAISMADGRSHTDRGRCLACGLCARACSAHARALCGEILDESALFSALRKDAPFFAASGGGVTFSGGEPLLQNEFAAAVCARCHAAGIRTAIDTAGCVPWARFETVLNVADLFLYDVKCVDEALHLRITGASNHLALENLRRLVARGKRVIVRVPVVPGFNANAGEMEAIAETARRIGGIARVELLPFHRLGLAKYGALGRECPCGDVAPVAREALAIYQRAFATRGIDCEVGSG